MKKFIAVASTAMLVALTGCLSLDPRTSNQGGGSLISAGAKVAGGSLATLTPDEIQILADEASNLSPDIQIPELTDDQAEVVSEFLQVNNVNTLNDIEQLVENFENDPDSIVIPDEVTELFDAGVFRVNP